MQPEIFQHGYLFRRNTVAPWSGYDSLERWREHESNPQTLDRLRQWGWYPFVDIEYRYNSHGFRDEEFAPGECGLALGCSYTEGVGVALEHSWPKQLESMMGTRVWNLGISGTGITTAYRAMEFFLPRLRPQFVMLLDPPIARLEIISAHGKWQHLLNVGWENSDVTSPQDQFVKHWFARESTWILQHRVYVRAMQDLAQQHGVKFRHLYHGPICQPDPDYQEPRDLIVDRGRDLTHVGPETLRRTAEIMADLLDTP